MKSLSNDYSGRNLYRNLIRNLRLRNNVVSTVMGSGEVCDLEYCFFFPKVH